MERLEGRFRQAQDSPSTCVLKIQAKKRRLFNNGGQPENFSCKKEKISQPGN